MFSKYKFLSADFLSCFRKAPYPDAVLATLSEASISDVNAL